uniref:Uncharacterized protein n=1 Tax=Vespula pensylvanica TaxID=30213 RepID=A0A834UG66_VESPE|nr:hypothetical protein H0235_000168 [Vespula pensylvanica]
MSCCWPRDSCVPVCTHSWSSILVSSKFTEALKSQDAFQKIGPDATGILNSRTGSCHADTPADMHMNDEWTQKRFDAQYNNQHKLEVYMAAAGTRRL